eukprot:6509632-Prymnesium_polylepis.1
MGAAGRRGGDQVKATRAAARASTRGQTGRMGGEGERGAEAHGVVRDGEAVLVPAVIGEALVLLVRLLDLAQPARVRTVGEEAAGRRGHAVRLAPCRDRM